MRCSECGGVVWSTQHAVFRTDGSSSGEYWCTHCGAKKAWKKEGIHDHVIDMSEDDK